MILPADIRALRARLDENQETFGQRFGLSRFHVVHWEKYGIASEPELERDMQKLINGGNSE
jgi:DNA-binding XRE family transcriptional regulator